jgi:hypothetical protein
VGWTFARLGEYDQARARCEAALILHRRHSHRYGEAPALDTPDHLGHPHLALGHDEQARTVWREALELYQS